MVGKEGEDLTRHDKWLCMMYPRLKLLQKLLAEDGAIFISIDDTEYANLKLICDEIFGSNCFVSNISWQRTYSTRNDSKGIVNEVEHLVVYSKQPGWNPNKLPRTEEMNARYKNPDNDEIPWKSSDAFCPRSIFTSRNGICCTAPVFWRTDLPNQWPTLGIWTRSSARNYVRMGQL